MKRLFYLLLALCLLTIPALAQESYWLLGADGGVYRSQQRSLQRVGLGTGTCLAVAASHQRAYVVGQDSRIWSAGPNGTWQPLAGEAKAQRVEVGPGGNLYILGLDGGIYRQRGNSWERQGLASARDLAVDGSGGLYVIGTDSHVWSSRDGRQWGHYNGVALGKRIAVSADGRVYILGTDDGVYAVQHRGVQRLGLVSAQEISVDSSGRLGIVGTDGGVYLQNGSRWDRLGHGTARQIVWPR